MKEKSFLVLGLIGMFVVACGSPRPPEVISVASSPSAVVSQQSVPEQMTFEGMGKAADFAVSRRLAYQDVMRKAIVALVGEKAYTAQKNQIDAQFVNTEAQFAPYIVAKKWTTTRRDENGDLILGLEATIATKKLESDLRAAGFLSNEKGGGSSSLPVAKSAPVEEKKQEDFSNVDISGVSILIYYNTASIKNSKDPDAERYARKAVQLLNQELLGSGLQVFDLEAAEQVAKEKNLLQEEARGNVGLGLLLAQQVYAEVYGEVVPTVTYRGGTVAHCILELKLYTRTGARVLASIQKGGEEYDSPSLEASLTASMRDSAKKVAKELRENLKKYVFDGRFYTVRLIEVGSARDASSFVSAVAKLDGVKSVKQTLYSKNDRTAEYEVQFRGTPNDLMERIFDSLITKPGFENLDLSTLRGNELIFTMQ
jgi:hypothetical protein